MYLLKLQDKRFGILEKNRTVYAMDILHKKTPNQYKNKGNQVSRHYGLHWLPDSQCRSTSMPVSRSDSAETRLCAAIILKFGDGGRPDSSEPNPRFQSLGPWKCLCSAYCFLRHCLSLPVLHSLQLFFFFFSVP